MARIMVITASKAEVSLSDDVSIVGVESKEGWRCPFTTGTFADLAAKGWRLVGQECTGQVWRVQRDEQYMHLLWPLLDLRQGKWYVHVLEVSKK